MEIKDLQPRQGKVEIVVEIVDKGEVREFSKFGNSGRVCNAAAKDATGEIKLSLWNEQVDQVNVGDKVKISNGYVSEFQGEKWGRTQFSDRPDILVRLLCGTRMSRLSIYIFYKFSNFHPKNNISRIIQWSI